MWSRNWRHADTADMFCRRTRKRFQFRPRKRLVQIWRQIQIFWSSEQTQIKAALRHTTGAEETTQFFSNVSDFPLASVETRLNRTPKSLWSAWKRGGGEEGGKKIIINRLKNAEETCSNMLPKSIFHCSCRTTWAQTWVSGILSKTHCNLKSCTVPNVSCLRKKRKKTKKKTLRVLPAVSSPHTAERSDKVHDCFCIHSLHGPEWSGWWRVSLGIAVTMPTSAHSPLVIFLKCGLFFFFLFLFLSPRFPSSPPLSLVWTAVWTERERGENRGVFKWVPNSFPFLKVLCCG